MMTPEICGTLRRNPKVAPEVSSIKLFGPGVMEPAKVNTANAVIISMLMAEVPQSNQVRVGHDFHQRGTVVRERFFHRRFELRGAGNARAKAAA